MPPPSSVWRREFLAKAWAPRRRFGLGIGRAAQVARTVEWQRSDRGELIAGEALGLDGLSLEGTGAVSFERGCLTCPLFRQSRQALVLGFALLV